MPITFPKHLPATSRWISSERMGHMGIIWKTVLPADWNRSRHYTGKRWLGSFVGGAHFASVRVTLVSSTLHSESGPEGPLASLGRDAGCWMLSQPKRGSVRVPLKEARLAARWHFLPAMPFCQCDLVSLSRFPFKQVPLEEGLNKAIHYFRKELEYQANNQYIPKPKPARIKKGRTRHNWTPHF